MLVLTIVSYKKYIKYAISQLIIVIVSMIPAVLMSENIIEKNVLSIVASAVSVVNFVICLIFCAKDVREAIIRKLHM